MNRRPSMRKIGQEATMTSDKLRMIDETPRLNDGRMVLAFSGWMDGGDVSTGTVKRLVDRLDAQPFAEIEPEGFYIYNFPGDMEVSSLFRPHIKIADGIVQSYDPPANRFYCDPQRNLVLFVGKEPHLNWSAFGQCIFEVVERTGVTQMYYVGSFGGAVPHTRQPRLYATVSDENLKPAMARFGLRFSDYEGPGSFTTSLLTQAARRELRMTSIVAEIPGYLQGMNPPSIEAVTRRLSAILGLPMDTDAMRGQSDEWESRVTAAVEENPELAEQIRKLEEKYDDDLLESPLAGQDGANEVAE